MVAASRSSYLRPILTLAWLARPEKKEAMVVLLVFLVCCSQVELQGWLADTGLVARGVVGGGRETEQPARSPHPAGKQPPPKPPQPSVQPALLLLLLLLNLLLLLLPSKAFSSTRTCLQLCKAQTLTFGYSLATKETDDNQVESPSNIVIVVVVGGVGVGVGVGA